MKKCKKINILCLPLDKITIYGIIGSVTTLFGVLFSDLVQRMQKRLYKNAKYDEKPSFTLREKGGFSPSFEEIRAFSVLFWKGNL